MDCEPDGIRHDDCVRKNTSAPKQHVPLQRNELHQPNRLRELLQRRIEFDDFWRPIAQQIASFAYAASVALVLTRKLAIAFRACPRSRHSPLQLLVARRPVATIFIHDGGLAISQWWPNGSRMRPRRHP